MKTKTRKPLHRTRPNQVFVGELTDYELGIIEDCLVWAKEAKRLGDDFSDELVMKLYKFWEK